MDAQLFEPFAPDFVDRDPQVKAFEKLLARTEPRALFLVGGEADMGKSFLLDQFAHMAQQQRMARLDFRGQDVYNFLTLIQAVARDLGRERFQATRTAIQQWTNVRHDVELTSEPVFAGLPAGHAQWRRRAARQVEPEAGATQSSVDQRWQTVHGSQTNIAGDVDTVNIYASNYFPPATTNPLQRQNIEDEISAVFYQDLGRLAQDGLVLLIYDSFEAAPDEAIAWLRDGLIKEIAGNRLPGVLVVIAGRCLPMLPSDPDANPVKPCLKPLTHVMEAKTIKTHLMPFDDLAIVAQYWVRRGLAEERLEQIFAETGGHPRKLADRATEAGGEPLPHRALVL